MKKEKGPQKKGDKKESINSLNLVKNLPFISSFLRFYVLLSVETPFRIGCFKDDEARDLAGLHMDSTILTVEQCADFCQYWGYLYAGLQRRRCFCDDSFGKYGTGDPSTCNTPCPGNATQMCGGYWRSDVYYLGR